MKTRYYLGDIKTQCGDYVFISTIKFQIQQKAMTPERALDLIASNWYDDGGKEPREKECDGYFFNGGEVFVEAGSWQSVTRAIFDRLTLITEL